MQSILLFLSHPIQNLIRILPWRPSLMPRPLLLLTHNNGRNPYYDVRKARAIEIPVCDTLSSDGFINPSVQIRSPFSRDKNGLRRAAASILT